MNEINGISLYVAFRLIIIRLNIYFGLIKFFPTLLPFFFWTYFVLHG